MEDFGVGKEYLENALGFPIERFEVKLGSNLGDGYSCALFGVDIWKPNEPENPRSIVVKCYPENESRQQFLDAGNIFQVELGMYDTVIPALNKFQEFLPESERVPLPFAPIIFGQYIKPEDRSKLGRPLKPLDISIVMPDLRKPQNGPFLLRDRFLGFDLDHYRLVIEGQAKLHAISWVYKCKRGLKSLYDDFSFLNKDYGDILKMFMSFTESNIKTNEALFQDRPDILGALGHLKSIQESIALLYWDCDMGPNDKGCTKDNILKRPGEIVENEVPWRILLHGDCWSNNMMFRYDEKTGKPVEVVFIDLQMSRESDPMNDLCNALYLSAQPGLIRKHLQSMLHVYFDTFTGICEKFGVPLLPGWSWKEFNRRFRRAKVMGGFMVLGLHLILKCPDELVNLDDAMAKLETNNGDGKSNAMQNIGELFSGLLKTKKIHPAVLPRIISVFEDLIEDGIL